MLRPVYVLRTSICVEDQYMYVRMCKDQYNRDQYVLRINVRTYVCTVQYVLRVSLPTYVRMCSTVCFEGQFTNIRTYVCTIHMC